MAELTETIDQATKATLEAAKNTADLIEGTVKKDGDGSELVTRTNEAFTKVAESSSKVGELVAEIAAASQEQASGIEQVNKAVTEMDKVVQQNAVNAHRADRDAINIVYKSLQQDREEADISDIIRQLHQVVDEAIETTPDSIGEDQKPYDISRIDFEKLKQEFERSPSKRTTVQSLKQAVEKRLQRLLQQNPLRTDFQQHYEEIVAEYNREKDRVTIERTFEALLKLVQDLDEEETRAVREGLGEETLAIFDLLKKQDLSAADIKRIKSVAVDLLEKLKAEKLRIDQWREKESTRDAVRVTIQDFLWSDETGLPVDSYTEDDVQTRTDEVFRHVFWAYPMVPSPYYQSAAAT